MDGQAKFALVSALCASLGGACGGEPTHATYPIESTADVARFDVAEIVLLAGQPLNGERGKPNPFDIAISAVVISPSGRRYEVPGFFDGDGRGGTRGAVFRIRVFADEVGRWTWRSRSELASLDGLTGSFSCTSEATGAFRKGPIIVSPEYPSSFAFREGDPVYLLGKFLDLAAPKPLRFSHTLFSERLSDSDRRAMLERHAQMNLNYMSIYVANRGDYGRTPTTPWIGNSRRSDKRRFDLKRWQSYERWIRALERSGMIAQLWFFADDSDFGELKEEDRERLLGYGMARLSAFVNTMFVLALEWQEDWSRSDVQRMGRFVQDRNPWRRLLSVHGTTGAFAYPNDDWADFMIIQSGNDSPYARVHEMGVRNRALAEKPLINQEFGLGEETDENRRKAWSAFLAGAAGSGTGAFLQHLASLVERVDFYRMRPALDLVADGQAYALAESGRTYVVYLPEGGEVTLDLGEATGELTAAWFNPRVGETADSWSLEGGSLERFSAPDKSDWVLVVKREGQE